MATTVLLVRHGATGANVSRPHVLQGVRPDNTLIQLGIEQAAATGEELRRFPVTRVYSSPLKRARQTAEYIAKSLKVRTVVDEEFVEADVGVWSGLTWPDIQKRWPTEYLQFEEDAEFHGYLGGENMAQVRDRARKALQRLRNKHPGETITVVAHGVVNRVLLADAMRLPLRYARRIPQENGAYNVLELSEEFIQIRTLNAKPHPQPALGVGPK